MKNNKAYLLILAGIILFNLLFSFNEQYTIVEKGQYGNVELYLRNISSKQYSIYFNSLPPIGKIHLMDNVVIRFFGFIPYWVTNVFYAMYIAISLLFLLHNRKTAIKYLTR
jgi:hypothetical protein